MAMRILFQSLIETGRTPAYFSGMQERVTKIARPGVTVDFVGMPTGIYGPYAPSEVVKYPYMAAFSAQLILENALRAESEGYDVFAIGSVQDPALEEARSLIDIPVVGYGESAMHLACCLSTKFVVLVFQQGFDQMMDLRIERLGMTSRALPTVVIEADFEDVGRGLSESEQLVARFERSAREAIARGAEAVIPGQLYLSEAIARAGVTRIDDAPVVDGLSATLKMAEVMADFKRLGIDVTRRGYLHACPPRDMIDHARQFHGRANDGKR
jgi:Asp/Glu/hydantoin racemase